MSGWIYFKVHDNDEKYCRMKYSSCSGHCTRCGFFRELMRVQFNFNRYNSFS